MSYNRNMKWLNDRRIVYRRDPITDVPTYTTDTYSYYANGTYQSYNLFNSKSKITTYKSLKWHYLVLYYLNMDNIINSDFVTVARFIAKKENGFVTFFIKNKILEEIIGDVLMQGGEPPVNRKRKIIFKDYSGLSFSEKMTIVGKLSGRQKLDATDIYEFSKEYKNPKYERDVWYIQYYLPLIGTLNIVDSLGVFEVNDFFNNIILFFINDGIHWFILKTLFFMFCFIWFRATFPRYRYDQIMRLGWKILIPLTLVWIFVEMIFIYYKIGPWFN